MAKRYIGDAVITIEYDGTSEDGREKYSGTVRAGGKTWKFSDLQSSVGGFRTASDSPEAYDEMARSAASFGSYYSSSNRGDDAPDWAPDPETADAIDEAVSWAQDDRGEYEVRRSAKGPAREEAHGARASEARHEITGPGTDGIYHYRGASIELSDAGTRRWRATVRFKHQEKDFEAQSSDEALEKAKDWIDAAPEHPREAPRAGGARVAEPNDARDVLDGLGPYLKHEGHDPEKTAARIARLIANARGSKRIDAALEEVNKLIGGHGVEAIRDENAWDNYYGDAVALYVNTGDTYTATLLYDLREREFHVTSWGEWYEQYEQQRDAERGDEGESDEEDLDEAPHAVADFSTLPELVKHARTEGATHTMGSGPQTKIYFSRGDGQYEEATVWKKESYWHAQGPGSRTVVRRLPAGAVPITSQNSRRAAEARGRRGIYHDTAAQDGDYVVHVNHRGVFVVDRVGRGGTHTTIGPTRGYSTLKEALSEAARDSHIQGNLAGVVFFSHGDDLNQIGNIQGSRFVPGGGDTIADVERFVANLRGTREAREPQVARDYIAVDRNDRRVAGPFRSRGEAEPHVPPDGYVKFSSATRRRAPPAPSSYPMFRERVGETNVNFQDGERVRIRVIGPKGQLADPPFWYTVTGVQSVEDLALQFSRAIQPGMFVSISDGKNSWTFQKETFAGQNSIRRTKKLPTARYREGA